MLFFIKLYMTFYYKFLQMALKRNALGWAQQPVNPRLTTLLRGDRSLLHSICWPLAWRPANKCGGGGRQAPKKTRQWVVSLDM